ncbi:Endonuclease/exonuclease/phosphatase [Parasponia andersonii]|uniref:Endonuclease/exonuclease/phosphatase n=1 Tax=Parasponia andersonii TaxID=3476 RepID=A0A2P5BGF9_PARAD|nr:Endonuclease/exonuclease/phosphatase [Parasponia andersonii]
MSCDASASSWLWLRHPSTSCSSSPKRYPSFFSAVSCCTESTPADSSSSVSTRSYGRPWYNPLGSRRRELDRGPEISRLWVEADDQTLASPERFTVASYNTLADRNAFAHKDLYVNVPYAYMKWSRRKRVICEELIGWNPDIICLQEVDKYFDISDILAKAGYVGSYKRRTGDTADGCATFWKADKFRLLEGENIEFKGLGLRDNVAQLSVFEMCKATSRRLLIGNIHVLYNPSRGDVKLGQIRFLSSRAHVLSEKWGNAPVLLTGDFNSTPQSAIYKFLSSSEVSCSSVVVNLNIIVYLVQLNIMLYNRRELSGQRRCHPAQVFGVKQEISSPFSLIDGLLKNSWTDEEVKVATGNSECHVVVHPLNLSSSYAAVKGSTGTREPNGEPLATSYHSKFLGTVDYMWYSDDLLPTRVLDTVSIDILRRTGGLPCKKVGSDHLALVSEFAFTQSTNEGNNPAASFISATDI